MTTSRTLVIGSTGTVGSQISDNLKRLGVDLVETTRDPQKTNDSTVFLDILTQKGLATAFENVDRAFLMSPPGYADQFATLSPLIQEAKKRKLKKVVLMTAYGADAQETTPFRRAEKELENSGLEYNIIRPNWFFQNFNSYWIHSILTQNQIRLPAGEARVSFIDARDIAAVATELLLKNDHPRQAFNLTGGQSSTHHEVAEAITKATGRKITYVDVPQDELKAGLLAAGLSQEYAAFLLMIMGYLKEGYNAKISDSVVKVLKREPISLSQYCTDYKKSWVK